jgi:bifunctional non-homologous end joining protein LigD
MAVRATVQTTAFQAKCVARVNPARRSCLSLKRQKTPYRGQGTGLTDGPFDVPGWIFEDKYDGFRMVAKIESGKITLYGRNGQVMSRNYIEVAKALEGVKGDAVIDSELVASLTRTAFLISCSCRTRCAVKQSFFTAPSISCFRRRRLAGVIERNKRLKAILPKDRLVAFSRHRTTFGAKFFEEAGRKGLKGILAKRASSKYLSGARQEVVIAGYTAPRKTRPFFGTLVFAIREGDEWTYIGHVGTGFGHAALEELHGRLIKQLKTAKSPFARKVEDETATTWVKPPLIAKVKFTEWTSSGEMRHPVYHSLREDKQVADVAREQETHKEA